MQKKSVLKVVFIVLIVVMVGFLCVWPNLQLSAQLKAQNLEERVEDAYEEIKEYEILKNISIYEKILLEISTEDAEYRDYVMYSQNAALVGISEHGYFDFASDALEKSVSKYLEVTGQEEVPVWLSFQLEQSKSTVTGLLSDYNEILDEYNSFISKPIFKFILNTASYEVQNFKSLDYKIWSEIDVNPAE